MALLPATGALGAVRVAVISDMNGSYGSTAYESSVGAAVARLVELRPDLAISAGDMIAGQRLHPPLARPALEAMWESFHRTVSAPLRDARIPLAVTPGNHDASSYAAFALERDVYREQWAQRDEGLQFVDREGYPFRYAFSVRDALFVSIDATRVGALEPEQLEWFDRLLTTHGARFRHRVVFGHLPIYPFSQGRETEVSADHDLERLLQRHGVELFLSGHHHAFYPGYRDGVRHVGQACLGAGPRRLVGSADVAPRAITWLVLDDDGITVEAYAGPGFDRPVDVTRLPPRIHSRFGTLVRDDLRPASTTPRAPARAPAAGGH